ncbi:MAG: AAA family ATPase [candidate division Zixibacteria bacterium]|nr:AAA family ATPase [candidate division Zixibacteria bacterium]
MIAKIIHLNILSAMIIRHLNIKNFRKYAELDLAFPDGVIGVVGRNGSGKSTLLEVFAWMFYGSNGLKTKNIQIYPDFAQDKGQTEGELDFMIGAQNFRIRRGFKKPNKSTAELYAEDKILATGTKEVNREVEKLSGMDWKAFQTSFYTRQNELNLLGSLQPAERSKRLEEMLGLEKTNIIINNIKGDLRSLTGEIKGLEQLIEREDEYKLLHHKKLQEKESTSKSVNELEDNLKSLDESLKKLKASFAENEKKREEHQKESSRLELLNHDLKKNESDKDKTKAKITAIEAQKERFEHLKKELKALPEVQENLNLLEKQQLKFESKTQKGEQLSQLEKSLESQLAKGKALSKSIEELKNRAGDTAIINNNIKEIGKRIESLQEEVASLREEKAGINSQLTRLKGQMDDIEELGPEAVCSFCLRPFKGEMHDIQRHFKDEIEKLESSWKETSEKLDSKQAELKKMQLERKGFEDKRDKAQQTQKELSSSEGERKNLRENYKQGLNQQKVLQDELKALGDIDFDPEVYRKTKAQFEDLQKISTEYAGLRERMASLDSLKKERGELLEKNTIINNNIKEIQQELMKIGFDSEAHQREKEALDKKTDEREEARDKLSKARETLAGLNAEIKGYENQLKNIDEAKGRSSEISTEKFYLESLIELLAELKTELAARIRPILIQISSNLLDRMSDSKFSELDLNKDYEISVRDYGELQELNRFSGGEQDLANLSLRLAISKLLAQSSRLEAGFLILDEVFGSQDSFRKENIMGAISGLQDFFQQIFIVTHVEDVKEAVQTLLTVEENHDGSSSVIVD